MQQRYSHQRELIFEELKKADSHLTADEIYKIVKKKAPKISFGTVYRNLGVLEHSGKIRKVVISSERAVYEAEERPHHHLICSQCGDIQNVFKPASFKCVSCLSWVKDFNIEDAYINAFGKCGKCGKK
ncbi:Fur family transcriptional regulator [Patescibacteria group bacterium]